MIGNDTISERCQDLLDYWRDIFETEETKYLSDYDIYRDLTYNGCSDVLEDIVRTASEEEINGAFNSQDEHISFYYRQKLWWRYADVINNNSEIIGDDVIVGDSSSIHELPLLPSTFVELHQLGCNTISDIKDIILNYELGSDVLGDLIAARRVWR